MTGLSESTYIRQLIIGYKPKERPDDRFYEYLELLRRIGNNLKSIYERTNYYNYLDTAFYNQTAKKLEEFYSEVKEKYLYANKMTKKERFDYVNLEENYD